MKRWVEASRFNDLRRRMVQRQLERRGITDAGVLTAMSIVPREQFLPPEMGPFAYQDSALPLRSGQTISQPYVVALMAQALALQSDHRVLEVGTGSGYAAAVLSQMVRSVDTVERLPTLARQAQARLAQLGFANVEVHEGDGSVGWAPGSPYDAICVSAAAPSVPAPLLDQLAPTGRLVVPVGPRTGPQNLVLVRRRPEGWVDESLGSVRFVPLLGDQGWTPS